MSDATGQYGEPWSVVPIKDVEAIIRSDILDIENCRGRCLLPRPDLDEPEFHRIVRCVNFLAGIPDEWLDNLMDGDLRNHLPSRLYSLYVAAKSTPKNDAGHYAPKEPE